jgi:hypothetical protein
MANVSHRLGKQSSPEPARAAITGYTEMADAFERRREYLRGNGVDLGATQATVGPLTREKASLGSPPTRQSG